MKRLVMLKGLPASGKSTWAKQFVTENKNAVKRVNKDELRDMLDCGAWSRDAEAFVLHVRDVIIIAALGSGKHVIVDDTNFAPKHEAHLREIAKKHGATFEIKEFDTPIDECIARDLQRSRSVGERVIRKMYNDYLRPKPPEQTYNDLLDDCIICDLDGTLAHLNGRNPYDASTCKDDQICLPVMDTISAMLAQNNRVIFMSGREEKHRAETQRWLSKMGFDVYPLYMRPTGDTRKDSIIKRELYEQHIKDKFNVLFVLDDRNQVVELWRSLGLTCFQVAEGDF